MLVVTFCCTVVWFCFILLRVIIVLYLGLVVLLFAGWYLFMFELCALDCFDFGFIMWVFSLWCGYGGCWVLLLLGWLVLLVDLARMFLY